MAMAGTGAGRAGSPRLFWSPRGGKHAGSDVEQGPFGMIRKLTLALRRARDLKRRQDVR